MVELSGSRIVMAIGIAAVVGACSSSSAEGAHAMSPSRLVALERSECGRVPPGDVTPGLSGLHIVRVSVLERPVKLETVVEGVAVVLERNGRSYESLERLLRCRASHSALVRDPSDPLAVPGATVRVLRDDEERAIVQIRSRKSKAAKEIVRRATLIATPASDGSTVDGDIEPDAQVPRTDPGERTPQQPPPRGPSAPGGLGPPNAGPVRRP